MMKGPPAANFYKSWIKTFYWLKRLKEGEGVSSSIAKKIHESFLLFWYNNSVMAEKDDVKGYLEKIESLVYSADKFNEMSFRMVLEGLVARGGEDAEYLLVRFINSNDLDLTTRINIIRVVSYIQSPHFLIPLKKIIDTEDNIHLKKEAVISVSKYNDRRALNILNYALAKIKNSLLLQTINTEIAKIKKNNPLFSLLPRFLDGENNQKNLRVTIDILKRILNPIDASMFVSYLGCGKEVLENGAFEVLCFTADSSQKKVLLTFFQDRFDQVKCNEDEACEEFYGLTLKLKHYYSRFPQLIDEELDNLGTQMYHLKNHRLREVYISIICQSQQAPAVQFIGQIYGADPLLREIIIQEYSGNEGAVDFLFAQYGNKKDVHSEAIMRSLLNSKQGIDYFYDNFSVLGADEQEVIVNHLPYGGKHHLGEFINMIFESEHNELKECLLQKVHTYHEYSVQDVLFDPEREREFFFMERQYLDTITTLFPISSIKLLIEKIIDEDLSINKTRKYLQRISELLPMGISFNFPEKDEIATLMTRVVLFNNPDLSVHFLSMFKHMKTMDHLTFRNLSESLATFTTLKEKGMSVKEANELRKAKKNFNEMALDLRQINEGLKSLERNFNRQIVDFDQLSDCLNQNGLSVALHVEKVTGFIETRMMGIGQETLKDWISLLNQFPMIGFLVREAITTKAEAIGGPVNKVLVKFLESMPKRPPRIVIRLTSKPITALIREQCMEVIPGIPVEIENDVLEDGDLLLCDAETLKEFILKNTLPSQKLFLLLDRLSDFSSYKSYNPRPLVKPFSSFRILKELLKELYV
jgi:hypothetical protein